MAIYPSDDEIVNKYSGNIRFEDKEPFASEYHLSKKSNVAYLLLLLFFGGLGIHKFYLGQTGLGVLYLLTGGILGFGTLFDLFTFLAATHHHNDALAYDISQKYTSEQSVSDYSPWE